MERYNVFLTDRAKRDIQESIRYIRVQLREPYTAVRIRERIRLELDSLREMPERYALVQDAVLASVGLRKAAAGNYLIFYRVSKENRSVRIERIINGRQNWEHILQNQEI